MCVWLTPQTDQTQFRACRILHSPHSALVGGIHVCMTTSRSLCVPSFSKSVGVILTSFHLFCRFTNFTRQPVYFSQARKNLYPTTSCVIVSEHHFRSSRALWPLFNPIQHDLIWCTRVVVNSWYKSLGGNVSCRSFCCSDKWSKTPLFFLGLFALQTPATICPSATLSLRERRVHAGVFFRMVVKQVKLKETGLQSTTELSSHKYTFFRRCPVSCYLIFSQKNSSTSSKVRPLKWGNMGLIAQSWTK